MSDENNSNVYNHYLELSKPTKEDLKRVFTEDELKELCLKHKCRVNMWRWNVANEYRIVFTESGRYQRWSERDRLRMLAKAVNKMKPAVLYDEEEILKTRKEEWAFQLKENILSLDYWRREELRNKSPRLRVSESEEFEELSQMAVNTESMNVNEFLTENANENQDFDLEVERNIEVHTESMNSSELLTQSQGQKVTSKKVTFNNSLLTTQTQGQETHQEKTTPINRQSVITENVLSQKELDQAVESQLEVNTESMNVNELLTQTQQEQLQQPLEEVPFVVLTPATSTQSDNDNILLADIEDDDIMEDDEDSEDSIETVQLNSNERQIRVQVANGETLQSQEVAPEIENLYDVNTMSMSIDSQMVSQSQELPYEQSQDVIPASYDNFINIIPVTSTQSQSEVLSQEIV
ncbi:hypothetical protein FF38_10622 [Lucilia cuprina]|uniref:Telomere-binding protein cav n=1 Tax=Lucilia cuprina TaxID=7375 RepID=A0A0L0CAU0_LUCCU|nr:Telomere-binding protein cav [Lucilia cuprina]KNC29350.1 hypothetical protein FF38_10622 [Lucilia cuprina]